MDWKGGSMKLKYDFITNSSSCSYIVCIPDMHDFVKELHIRYPISNYLKHMFLNSHQYISFQEEDISYAQFHEMNEVIDKMGYVLMFDETAPENQMKYMNIASNEKQIEKIKKILGGV